MARINLVSIGQVDLLTIFFVRSVPELRLQARLYSLKTGAGLRVCPERSQTSMRLRSLVTIALLVFVAASVTYLVLSDFPTRVENPGGNDEVTVPAIAAPSTEPPGKVEKAQHRIIAYYFHGTVRCATCRAIEQYTYEALVTGFPGELESGTLEWRPINVEEPQNQHFIDEYQLSMRSVILADMAGENQTRWKNLDRIWELDNKSAFISYIQEETTAYLEGN